MTPSVLTINSGSSSIKASLFEADGTRHNYRFEHVRNQAQAYDQLMQVLEGHMPDVVGHRFVHGGDITDAARSVDDAELARLHELVPLAPLHLPGNLMGLDLCMQRFRVPQVVCFDTAFHADMPELSKRLPIPNDLGFRRFGFHGLNYAYVASVLPDLIGNVSRGKVVVAHLGSGASLCLMENLKSVDTTMGYTPAGGIPMGTRSGDLDPGVMVELAKRYNPEQLTDLVFHQMGLLALSEGEHSEVHHLIASSNPKAHFAVEYFCRQVRASIGALAAKAGGLDALVFTGGIGEHSPEVRAKICTLLACLGVVLDETANHENRKFISAMGQKPVLVVPADEEVMIRNLCLQARLH